MTRRESSQKMAWTAGVSAREQSDLVTPKKIGGGVTL